MSDRKYYCFCDLNCKFETMTKEQILSAIAQAAENGLVFDPDAAFVTKVKESNVGGFVTFWAGTQAQYNALQTKDKNCIYVITDAPESDMGYSAATVTLKAGSWSSKRQSVSVSGVTTDNLVIVSPSPAKANRTAYAEYGIACIEQSAGVLTFECNEVPSGAISVNVAVFA